MVSHWVSILLNDISTYPKEGYPVIVSDGVNHDIAWYLMSGEYKWKKDNLLNDDVHDFTSFNVIKWSYID